MKLLVIINNLGKGGAENLIVKTIPEFQKKGIQVEVMQLSAKHSFPLYLESLKKAGVTVHSLGNKSIYNFYLVKKLKDFMRNRKYDLVHVHLFPTQYWVALALRSSRIPLVLTEHSSNNRRWGKFYFQLLDTYTYKKYARIIAVTEDVKAALANWIPAVKKNIVVINNGINLNNFSKFPTLNKEELLQQIGIKDSHAEILLMTARFEWPKKQQVIVQALPYLNTNVHLLLAGDGILKSNVEKTVMPLGLQDRVHFLGFRTDAASLMKTVDMNILSTDFEGLSTVAIEALAAGKPFLGSDVTGINNVVPDKRFLFDTGDEKDLASKIKKVLTDKQLSADMVKTAEEYVLTYDIGSMIDQHVKLYKELLGEWS